MLGGLRIRLGAVFYPQFKNSRGAGYSRGRAPNTVSGPLQLLPCPSHGSPGAASDVGRHHINAGPPGTDSNRPDILGTTQEMPTLDNSPVDNHLQYRVDFPHGSRRSPSNPLPWAVGRWRYAGGRFYAKSFEGRISAEPATALLTYHHDPEVVPLDRVEMVERVGEAVVVESSCFGPPVAQFPRRQIPHPARCLHLRVELPAIGFGHIGRQ